MKFLFLKMEGTIIKGRLYLAEGNYSKFLLSREKRIAKHVESETELKNLLSELAELLINEYNTNTAKYEHSVIVQYASSDIIHMDYCLLGEHLNIVADETPLDAITLCPYKCFSCNLSFATIFFFSFADFVAIILNLYRRGLTDDEIKHIVKESKQINIRICQDRDDLNPYCYLFYRPCNLFPDQSFLSCLYVTPFKYIEIFILKSVWRNSVRIYSTDLYTEIDADE